MTGLVSLEMNPDTWKTGKVPLKDGWKGGNESQNTGTRNGLNK